MAGLSLLFPVNICILGACVSDVFRAWLCLLCFQNSGD